MRFIDTSQLTRTFSRSYRQESAVSLSAIECALNGERAVYASAELTTGRRVHGVLREIGGSQPSELKARLGKDAYDARIWNPNVEAAMAFARSLHHSLGGNQLVITPAPFMAIDWTQQEYLGFWETLLRSRIKAVYFNDGWEYSDGCTFEYLVAVDAGLPTFDASGHSLNIATAIARIEGALAVLRRDNLHSDGLATYLPLIQERADTNRPHEMR